MSTAAAAVFVLCLFGYPIVGNLTAFAGIGSRVLSVPFRVFCVVLCLLLAVVTVPKIRLRPSVAVVLLWWLAYLVRFGYDISVQGIEGADFALQFFIVTAVLPSLALLGALQVWDDDKVVRYALLVSMLGCVMALSGFFLGYGDQDLTTKTGRLSTESLNPITIGYVGVNLCLTSILFMRGKGYFLKTCLLVLVAFGLATIALSASKGPAIALIICLTIVAVVRRTWLAIFFGAIVVVAGAATFVETAPALSRVIEVSDDESTRERITLAHDSFEQIAEYPWIGSAFVELKSGHYPHNQFIEAGLALGVPAAGVLVVLTLLGLRQSWLGLWRGQIFLSLLFVQAALNSVLSGSLWASGDYWVTLILLLSSSGNYPARPGRAQPPVPIQQLA